jgi:hypothetical protein
LGLTSGDPKSLFAWIKPSSISTTTGYTRLLNYMPDASNRFLLSLTSWNTPNNTYKISGTPNNNSATLLKTSNNYNLNEWRLVGWTFDGSSQNFYVDGVLQSSIADTSGSYGFTGNSGFIIGARTDTSGTFYKGNVGQVQIYNIALSATEILQNFNATKKKYSPEENIVTNGLVLNIDPSKNTSYPGIGNTIYDLSGSGINGTLINSPSFSALNGGQINMPGSSKYIDLGQNFNFTFENFSISHWVYLDSFVTINNAGQGPIPFFKGDFQQMGYFSQIAVNGSLGFFTNQGGVTQASTTSAGILTTSTWYNLSYVKSGSSVRLYLNGVDSTSVVGTHINPSGSNQTFKINYYKSDYLISGQM